MRNVFNLIQIFQQYTNLVQRLDHPSESARCWAFVPWAAGAADRASSADDCNYYCCCNSACGGNHDAAGRRTRHPQVCLRRSVWHWHSTGGGPEIEIACSWRRQRLVVVYGLATSIKCHTMVVTGTGKRSTHHVNGRVSPTVIGSRRGRKRERRRF